MQRIITGRINMARTSDYVDGERLSLVRQGLKNLKLLGDDFLYSIFSISNRGRVIETGSTRDSSIDNLIYAFEEKELVWNDGTSNCLKRLFHDVIEPAIAVLYRSHFKKESRFCYSFNNPFNRRESIVGIVKIRNYQ